MELVGSRILLAEGTDVTSFQFAPAAARPGARGHGAATPVRRGPSTPTASPSRSGRRSSSRGAAGGSWSEERITVQDAADHARFLQASEQRQRQRQRRLSEQFIVPGLTDDEMLAFALSLSLQEASASPTPSTGPSSADTSLLSSAPSEAAPASDLDLGLAYLDDLASDDDDAHRDDDGLAEYAPRPGGRWASLMPAHGARSTSWRSFGTSL